MPEASNGLPVARPKHMNRAAGAGQRKQTSIAAEPRLPSRRIAERDHSLEPGIQAWTRSGDLGLLHPQSISGSGDGEQRGRAR